jgi:4-azaleucine resistance transporter AzlC
VNNITGASSQPSRWREFVRGVLDEAPLMLGVVPFGLVLGVTVNAANMPPVAGQITSSVIFAGSSQLIFARLFGEGAPLITVFLTCAIVNLRHVLYSASIAPYFKTFSMRWKWLLSYLLTDEAYAMGIAHYEKLGLDAPLLRMHKQWYFLGVGLTLWVSWNISTLLGIFVGGSIPPGWGLDFAVPLTFIAIVVPALCDRAGIVAALMAGVLSVALIAMPLKLSLVSATLLGIVAGLAFEALGWGPKPTSVKA